MMITATGIIREQMRFILAFVLISLAVVLPYINTLQINNNLYRINLQLSIIENQQLLYQKAQLAKSVKILNDTNQKLNEEKKGLQNEIEQIKTDFKISNDALLEDKKELEKKVNQTNTVLHSVEDKNQKLLVERKTLNNKLQSAEDDAKSLLKEKEGLQNKISQLEVKIQLTNQQLLKEKIELLENTASDHEVHEDQVWFIDKWMNFIEQLGEHIHAIIQYTEELQNSEVMVKGINLLLKFIKECRKFVDALSLHKIEKMKNLQDTTDVEGPKKEMEEFKEFANGFKHQEVHQDERITINYNIHQEKREASNSVDLMNAASSIGSMIWSGVTTFAGWLFS